MSEEQVTIALPQPRFDSDYSIEKALLRRRSIRSYSRKALSLLELAQLLWSCQGISKVESWGRIGRGMQLRYRTTPSAGALFPLEVFVTVKRVEGVEPGLYHYLPGPQEVEHSLELVARGEKSEDLAHAALGQSAITEAAANIIIAGVIERTAAKYGLRARQYVLLEVGHAAQNVCLQALSLDIGVVMIGAFSDGSVTAFIGDLAEPFYILSVGKI